jgi:hypothetical protein
MSAKRENPFDDAGNLNVRSGSATGCAVRLRLTERPLIPDKLREAEPREDEKREDDLLPVRQSLTAHQAAEPLQLTDLRAARFRSSVAKSSPFQLTS